MWAKRCGAVLLLTVGLGACGGDSLPGFRVSCERGASVQPIERLQLRMQPATAQEPPSALLIFRDPLNKDQTATLRVAPGDSCAIGPATKV